VLDKDLLKCHFSTRNSASTAPGMSCKKPKTKHLGYKMADKYSTSNLLGIYLTKPSPSTSIDSAILPVYQNMVNLIVGFPIWRPPNIFMDVVMWEYRTFEYMIFDVANVITLTPLSLIISCKFSLPVAGLEMSSLPTLALKS
jgi:hypothetical protein